MEDKVYVEEKEKELIQTAYDENTDIKRYGYRHQKRR